MQSGVRAVSLEERQGLEVQLFVQAEPVIPALGRWRLKDSELKAILGLKPRKGREMHLNPASVGDLKP